MEELGMDDKDPGMGECQPKGIGGVFKVVVQAVTIFGLEMWVLNPHSGRSLGVPNTGLQGG